MLSLLFLVAHAFADTTSNTNYGCYMALHKASAHKLKVPFKGAIEPLDNKGHFAVITAKGVQMCDASAEPIANANLEKPVWIVGVQLPGHKKVTYLEYGPHVSEIAPARAIPQVCKKPTQKAQVWLKVIEQRLQAECDDSEEGGMSGHQQCRGHRVGDSFASCKGLGVVTKKLSQQLASPTEDHPRSRKSGQESLDPEVEKEDL